MARRSALVLVATLSALAAACGQEAEQGAPPAAAGPASVAGQYRVAGTTAVIGSADSRAISGHVILAQEGSRYTATFQLETLYPGPDGPLKAEVVGKGQGTIVGDTLTGTAQTQIVASRVPGIDSSFTLIPPAFGVRIVSNSKGTVDEDRILQVEIESQPAEGEDYRPTRTTLRGKRVTP